ncbi:hypothetical protein Tco_0448367 [Tanacetum coccineum]
MYSKQPNKPHGYDIITKVKKEEEPKDTPQKRSNDPTIIDELESTRIKEEKELEWLDIEEPLNQVDMCEESVYESLIKEIPRIILREDDYDRGCERPSDLKSGFYKDVDKLGPEYQADLKKAIVEVIFDEKKLRSSYEVSDTDGPDGSSPWTNELLRE